MEGMVRPKPTMHVEPRGPHPRAIYRTIPATDVNLADKRPSRNQPAPHTQTLTGTGTSSLPRQRSTAQHQRSKRRSIVPAWRRRTPTGRRCHNAYDSLAGIRLSTHTRSSGNRRRSEPREAGPQNCGHTASTTRRPDHSQTSPGPCRRSPTGTWSRSFGTSPYIGSRASPTSTANDDDRVNHGSYNRREQYATRDTLPRCGRRSTLSLADSSSPCCSVCINLHDTPSRNLGIHHRSAPRS